MSFISDLITGVTSFRTKVGEKLNKLWEDLGNKANLTTTNKTNVVAAVNEVKATAVPYTGATGDVDLNTKTLNFTEGGAFSFLDSSSTNGKTISRVIKMPKNAVFTGVNGRFGVTFVKSTPTYIAFKIIVNNNSDSWICEITVTGYWYGTSWHGSRPTHALVNATKNTPDGILNNIILASYNSNPILLFGEELAYNTGTSIFVDYVHGGFTGASTTDYTKSENYQIISGMALASVTNVVNVPTTTNSLSNYYTKDETLNFFVSRQSDQTINGTKTFANAPVVPAGTIDAHAVNLGQLKRYFGYVSQLGANDNLNDKRSATDMGVHVNLAIANATEANNYPVNKAGILTLFYASSTHLVQNYTTYDTSETYTRYYFNGTWRAWKRSLTNLDINSSVFNYTLTGANNAVFLPLKNAEGIELTAANNGFLYDISVNTSQTGTETGVRFVVRHNGTTWVVHEIGVVPKTSNYPWLFVDTDGIPKLRTNSSSAYSNILNVRQYNVVNTVLNWSRLLGLDFESLQNRPTTLAGYGITDAVTNQALIDGLQNKVDKEAGKGLSTNDYTTVEKNKLAGIQAGAEINVNADWTAASGDAQILNKPTTFAPSAHTHPISQVTNLQSTLDGKQNKLTAGANIQISAGNEISATDTTYAIFNVTNDGLVPKRVGSTTNKYLREDGTWVAPPNTTYSVGNGLTQTGTVFSLPVVQSGAGNVVSAVEQTTDGIKVSYTEIPMPNPVVFTNKWYEAVQSGEIEVEGYKSIIQVPASVTSFAIKPLGVSGATVEVYASGSNNTTVNFNFGTNGIVTPSGAVMSSFVVQANNGFTLKYVSELGKYLIIKQEATM